MAIKVEDYHIRLAVRDLLTPSSHSQMLSSFPLPQRGVLGRQAQTKFQQKSKQFSLFQTEYSISREFEFQSYTFQVYGRIDGIYQLKHKVELEEVKSVILSAKEFKALRIEAYPEFIEQVLFYAYLIQDQLEGQEIAAYLVLINLINDARRKFPVNYNRQMVEQKLFEKFSQILTNIEREKKVLKIRQQEIEKLVIEFPEQRKQQLQMMDSVKQALGDQSHLLVSAPTGTGKTAAALYPAIRYAYVQGKKIFFVTSKTTQQQIVAETLRPVFDQGIAMRVIFLRASEKMCANDVYFCHESYCPYAKDYRERLVQSNIIDKLLDQNLLKPDDIFNESKIQKLCPFEVSLDLSLHADIIVGDYNYVFDPAVFLRRLFMKKDYSDWILIIDEAHSLYDRGLQYLSPEIGYRQVDRIYKRIIGAKTKVYQLLRRSLDELLKDFNQFNEEGQAYYSEQQYFKTDINIKRWDENLLLFESAFVKYLIHKIKKRILIPDDPIESLYYQLRRFVQIARYQERAFVPFFDAQNEGMLKIQCCDPSSYLGKRIDGFHTTIAMSATLDPMDFYQNVLGMPAYRTDRLALDSPFPIQNRKLLIVPHVSTKFKERHKHYAQIADIIKDTIRLKSGNYLAFFPSFEFVQNVNLFLSDSNVEIMRQRPSMKEEDRAEVLQSLREKGKSKLLLAVMGGIFAEGIDYKGEMAIGVFVISPGLPKVSFERELLREYYDEKQNQGHEYAYIYPGMNKVIQSVGRLIRSATDRGVVILIGERFALDEYNALLPDYWFSKKGDVEITKNVTTSIKNFWNTQGE